MSELNNLGMVTLELTSCYVRDMCEVTIFPNHHSPPTIHEIKINKVPFNLFIYFEFGIFVLSVHLHSLYFPFLFLLRCVDVWTRIPHFKLTHLAIHIIIVFIPSQSQSHWSIRFPLIRSDPIRGFSSRIHPKMATMTSLIGLINKIQRACTVLGDHGGEGLSLWEALPSVAVVGGQVSSIFFFSTSFFKP